MHVAMTNREVAARLSGTGFNGAPQCVCRHGFYTHHRTREPEKRVCDWCGCTGFRARGGQVRLTGVWTGP